MSATFGKNLRVTIFGESHSAAIGVVIDGLPAGMRIKEEEYQLAMARRAPNTSAASTKRREKDEIEILSGYFRGAATGTPLTAVIRNTDTRSQDYEKTLALLRPGHADYTGMVKYHGANDYRGGGHFSGRLTAPLVFAGNLARQYLSGQGIEVGVHILEVAGIADRPFDCAEQFSEVEKKYFPVFFDEAGRKMQAEIEKARMEGDSVGGIMECVVMGVPAGVGEPFFDSVESRMAHMMFSIPAVKGIEFGSGFSITKLRGSAANDSPVVDQNGSISFRTNHNGGINGGITNGMPIVLRVALKPTPSISKIQKTVNVDTMENDTLQIVGRHDACIVPRAAEVIKGAAALVIADLLLEAKHG
ncbi:MAG: chorismate synthase [Christensenella sp.]|nr:chorismate synthase [Christensenella sp.]